jgi:hypothetical protein
VPRLLDGSGGRGEFDGATPFFMLGGKVKYRGQTPPRYLLRSRPSLSQPSGGFSHFASGLT